MATLFIDFENGNDNHGGTSFSPLASGTNGRITSTTFSSATASFPNDGSLIGQYLSIFNGTIYAVYNITAWVSSTSLTIAALSGGTALANQAVDRQFFIGGRWRNITTGATAVRTIPGDTIRMMGSPEPTSLGQNGVWTSQAMQATKAITGATNTTPISITCTAHGYSTGDTVVVAGVGVNIAPSVGTWEITVTGVNTFTLNGTTAPGISFNGSGPTARLRNNTRVMLTSAVTQNIASTGPGRAAWVASANCIHLFNTSFFKEHANSDAITVNTAFTTGKAAYYTLPSTLNLSSYQQISFWIYVSGKDLLVNEAELRLCSDTTGDTVVDTVPIPYTPGGRLRAVTWDKGSALGSSISSISLNINIDLSPNANVGLMFSNIIACKASSAADSLTLTSLIGKNTTGETFWGIQSINGTRVMLDADTNATPISTAVRGYYGTSETVTTWKRETIKLGPAATTGTALQTIQESGTDGSPITYSGGWDRTAMSTQNLETWLDGVNGFGYGIAYASLTSFTQLDKLAAVRFNFGAFNNQNGSAVKANNFDLVAVNNNSTGLSIACNGTVGKIVHCVANSGDGSVVGNSTTVRSIVIDNAFSNGNTGLFCNGGGNAKVASKNNGLYGIGLIRSGVLVYDSEAALNGSGGVYVNTSLVNVSNILIDEANEFILQNVDSTVYSQKHDQTANNHKVFTVGGLISTATDQRKTASGVSWKMQPTSSIRDSFWPLTLSLAKVACAANSLVTIKAWMRRTNTGLTMHLVCKGGQIAGVASDVVSAMTAAADTWAEQTITFTPTEIGVVEITAEAWGGTTFSGWVDDMTISQS
jgi:hypothetical protein